MKYLVIQVADVTAQDNEAVKRASLCWHLEMTKYLVSQGADITKIEYNMRKCICASRIQAFYRRQRDRKKIVEILRVTVPMYYHPQAKGGYFAKKALMGECCK